MIEKGAQKLLESDRDISGVDEFGGGFHDSSKETTTFPSTATTHHLCRSPHHE
jgi:hypothetical protein